MSQASYCLLELELLNWGPFDGCHRADIAPHGTAIVGKTASGKTTLVDALMTLLTERPRYNLASTGGHESDRDLMGYIRGVSGAGNIHGDGQPIARAQKTVTALSARFGNGEETIQLAVLMWIDSASMANADRKDLWLISRQSESLFAQYLELFGTEGARGLKAWAKAQEAVQTFDTKKAYLAQVRRFFEVSEQAFTLLNRAVGLKQLNSIDAIFRELVLEDQSAFKRASEVVAEFDDLSAIRAELELAKRQQASLAPLKVYARKLDKEKEKNAQYQQAKSLLPRWFAMHGQALWQARLSALDAQAQTLQASKSTHQAQFDALGAQLLALQARYAKAGGTNLQLLQANISKQKEIIAHRQKAQQQYQTICDNLGVQAVRGEQALQAQQQWAGEALTTLQTEIEALGDNAHEQGGKRQALRSEVAMQQKALSDARARPQSNIPQNYQDFRQDLATALQVSEASLPYVAELVAVQEQEQSWRGAIERAIGAHRLRLLVAPAQMQTALAWVNQRHNRLHVRLYEAVVPETTAAFFADGFTRKLQFKTHALREPLKVLLASIDRHCVADSDALHQTPHAMTKQGLMSGRRGYFDKQDQRALSANWLTGFDNSALVAQIEAEIQGLQAQQQAVEVAFRQASQNWQRATQRAQLLQTLQGLSAGDMDVTQAQQELATQEAQYQALTAPDSELYQLKQALDELSAERQHQEQQLIDVLGQIRALTTEQKQAQQAHQVAKREASPALSEAEKTLVAQFASVPEATQLNTIERLQRLASDELDRHLETVQKTIKVQEDKLLRQMGEAQKQDSGALSEAGTSLIDLPLYLERLKILNEEDLPAKQQRFLDYLTNASDQGVTQLLSGIDSDVAVIESRIEALNATLAKVDFQPDCYLRLNPHPVVHTSLREVETAVRHLRAAALKDDAGESHYQALQHLITLLRTAAENKRNLGAKALLDPRYRLTFSVTAIMRDGEIEGNTFTGSQSGSGGEKEIIASYILTASLSYALSPQNIGQPLFATIILDEAFSKSSQAVAGRIVAAIRAFGLHPLFVTPNKEMRLLREHTRLAILVHNKNQRASLATMSWQALDEQAQKRLATGKST